MFSFYAMFRFVGPVGSVAALLLARAGIPVTMIERAEDVVLDYRASTFHPPTLDLLEASGIECVVESRVEAMSPPVETALAWAVREAATNVIRLYSSMLATVKVGKRSETFKRRSLSLSSSNGRCNRSRASFWYAVVCVLSPKTAVFSYCSSA